MSGKKVPLYLNAAIFASRFAKCWLIFKIISQRDLAINF